MMMKRLTAMLLTLALILALGAAQAEISTSTDLTEGVSLGSVRIVCDAAAISEGDTVVLRAELTGYAGMQVALQWYMNGEPIKDATEETLTVTACMDLDGAVYTVEVTEL